MTVNEVQRSEGNRSGGPKKNEIANTQIKRLVHDLQQMRKDRDKVSIKGMDDLGPRTQEYLKNIYPELVNAVGTDGAIPRPMLKKIRDQLYKLDKLERHVMAGPKGGDQNGTIDARKIKVGDDAIKGLGEGALRALLKGFGLEQGYDQVGGAILDSVFNNNIGANVSDPKTWAKVGGQILDALISSDKGNIGARVGDALGKGTEALIDSVLESPRMNVPDATKRTGSLDKNFGPVPNADLGLERTAAKASNTGSINNAFAIRAQLLTGVSGQNEEVRNVTAKALKEVFRDLGVFQDRDNTGEDRIAKRKIHELVGSELQKLQTDGKIDASAMLHRFSEMVAERSPDDASAQLFKEMTGGLKEICDKNPEALASEDVQTCLALGAAMALSDLVGLELGKDVNHQKLLTEKLVPMLSELVANGFAEVKSNKPKEGDPTADVSRYDRAMPELGEARLIAEQYIDSVADQCQDKAQIPDTPFEKGSAKYNIYANILAEIHQVANGGEVEQPACIAAYQWLVDNAGLNPKFVETATKNLESLERQMGMHDRLMQSRIREYEAESKNIGSGQDHKKLQRLQVEISSLRSQIEEAAMTPLIYFQHAAKLISATVMDGRMHGSANPGDLGSVDATGGGGGKKPPRGGDPMDPGDPGDPRRKGGGGDNSGGWTRRGNLRSRGNMPSMTSPSGPHDQVDAPFYQRRANMLGDILSDSSLCIEDKIFFFMMWFVAFADDEREQKMKELIEMDRKQAETAEMRDKQANFLKEQKDKVSTYESTLDRAQDDLATLQGANPPDPQAIAAAQTAVEEAQHNVDRAKERENELERTVQDLSRQVDELPKSREVKFMELERLNQLRDKIMNMARSILENSNRNIEKIFR